MSHLFDTRREIYEIDANQALNALSYTDTGPFNARQATARTVAPGTEISRRLKNSLPFQHPIAGGELCASKRYLTTNVDKLPIADLWLKRAHK